MTPNEETIHRFYSAFQQRDATGMIACYHPEVRFTDPVFGELVGERAGAMWKMLCERGTDLRIEFGNVGADEQRGHAHWEAQYTFSTGRKVHNRIDATFEFADGSIIRHEDRFDLKAWAAQALGPMGRLFGGMRFVQQKIKASALGNLERYQNRTDRSLD